MDEAHGQDGFDDQTIGGRLRAAREARGLSLQDVANQTRIPLRHLQHIELEEWDELPAVTYCVGFARAYANAVGLDGAEIGREVRDSQGGPRIRTQAVDYFQPADPARVPPRPLAIIAAVIAIALVVGYAIWRSQLGDAEAPAPPPPTSEAPAPAAPQPVAPPAAVAGQAVSLTATGEVWLRITDGPGGAPLFQNTLTPGQTFAVPATAQRPFLRTGRPNLLRVTIGGVDRGALDSVERTVTDVSLRAEDLAARGAAPPPASPAR